MPILDGPMMARQMLLQDLGREKVPVLLVSGYYDLPRAAKRVGTPYHLPKPCSVRALIAAIERALRERTPPQPSSEGPEAE